MTTPQEAQASALAAAESFLTLLVRGFEGGYVKAKPVMNMDPNASQIELVSMHSEAVKCLDVVKKARAQ